MISVSSQKCFQVIVIVQ